MSDDAGSMVAPTRVLSLDVPLHDPRVQRASFGSTRTLLEHEIVLWDPARMLDDYHGTSTFEGSRRLADNPSARYKRDASRRWQEFHDYLGLGRLLVVLLPPPVQFFVATGEKRNEGTPGKPRMSSIVKAHAVDDLIPVDATLVSASGDSFQLAAGSPFADFWRAVGDQFHYVAYLRNPIGTPLLNIKGTDKIVSTLAEAHGGTVLLLPQRFEYGPDLEPKPDETQEDFDERWEAEQRKVDADVSASFVDALLELARELRGSPDEGLPEWASRFMLPGEQEALAAVTTADDKVAVAVQAADIARRDLQTMDRNKVLMTGTGRPLELAVERVLTELGCTVEAGAPGRTDRIVRWKNLTAVVEVKGLSKSAGEKDAAQLEKWVTEYMLEHGQTPNGLLLVNAWRTKPLDKRTQIAFPAQMVPFSANRGHCLATTTQLLTAAVSATSARKRSAFLKSLFETVGVLEGWDWSEILQEVAEPQRANSTM